MVRESFWLVRHGRDDRRGLTPEGLEDAHRARVELLAKSFGCSALILSSTVERAMQTAEVIADGLLTKVVPSYRIKAGGNKPAAIKNLDDWIQLALAEAGQPSVLDQPLVVVTHSPLLAVAKGIPGDVKGVRYGEVLEYAAGTWVNPNYQESVAATVEQDIARRQGPQVQA